MLSAHYNGAYLEDILDKNDNPESRRERGGCLILTPPCLFLYTYNYDAANKVKDKEIVFKEIVFIYSLCKEQNAFV